MTNPVLSFLELFKTLSALETELISNAFKQRVYKEGDILFNAGNTCKELFFICNGVLRILRKEESGIDVTYFFLKENQFCTILNSFNNNVLSDESIEAACDSTLLVISKTELLKLYEQLSFLKPLMDQIIQQGLLDKIQIKNTYLGLDSTTRYRTFMMRQPEIALRVSLSDVASYLGITPQSLSRIRRNIK